MSWLYCEAWSNSFLERPYRLLGKDEDPGDSLPRF